MRSSARQLVQSTARRRTRAPPAPTLPAPLLRALWRSTAQPVAVITACLAPSNTANHGATLSSLSSVSLAPPLVAFSLRLPSTLATFLLADHPAPFTVHLLSGQQEDVARAFARQPPRPAPLVHPPSPAPRPAPPPASDHFPPALFTSLASNSLGSLSCTVVHSIPLAQFGDGDGPKSQLFVARVDASAVPEPREGKERGSLVYWEQGYHAVGA